MFLFILKLTRRDPVILFILSLSISLISVALAGFSLTTIGFTVLSIAVIAGWTYKDKISSLELSPSLRGV